MVFENTIGRKINFVRKWIAEFTSYFFRYYTQFHFYTFKIYAKTEIKILNN